MVEIKNVETTFPTLRIENFEFDEDYLKSITVFYDLKGNGVFMPEFQRYNKWSNASIIMSQSTMHSMEKFMNNDDHDPFTKYVLPETKELIKKLYNDWHSKKEELSNVRKELNSSTDEKKIAELKVKEEKLDLERYETFEKLVHNLPRGFELWVTVSSNYLQLKSQVIQRAKHPNIEDWGNFIEFCYSLPHFRELCGFSDEKWDLDKLFPLRKSIITSENNG